MKLRIISLLLLQSLIGSTQTSELIFHSGFEPMSTLTVGGNDIIGVDNSVSPPNNWVNDLEYHPNIGNFSIFYEGGNDTMRFAKIVTDPTDSTNNILQYWLKHPNVSGTKGRVQAELYGNNNLTEMSQKVRIYLPSDWDIIKSADGGTVEWMVIMTLWNNAGWTGEGNPFKVSLGIHKRNPWSSDLNFNLTGDIKTTYWEHIWEESDSSYSIPVGQWLTLETYFKEGDASNGRFVLAVTPEGGTKQVIFDVTNFTHHPDDTSPDGMKHYNPMKLYTSDIVIDYVRNNDGVLQMYWDDFEIWKDTNTVLNIPKNEVLGNFKIYPNPMSKSSVLEFKNATNENHKLILYNTQGRVVRTITNIKSNQVIIEKGGLNAGLYFFQLTTKNRIIITGKILIE
ncbi:MAG: T9SS type A sorting domain-containing protein [Crocinitomix sp.]|nr:T9SS type A sorting domain-containing protein [Crocinitomix sp.]